MQITNWIVGLLLLSVMSVKLLWGADLVIVAHLTARRPRWRILVDGTLYLGWFFVTSAIVIYGGIGFVLLKSPNETTPLWFAVGVAMVAVDCILAWHFLRSEPDRAEGGNP